MQSIEDTDDSFSCYEYSISIDNIRVGFSEYKNEGIYVSSPLFLTEESGVVGLTVKEKRPYLDTNDIVKYTDTFDASQNYIGSIEYWVIKEDLDSDTQDEAQLVKRQALPIYPMNTAQIFHERLLLVESEDSGASFNTGYLSHYPDISESITVYRNGDDIGYSIASFDQTDNIPNNSEPMKFKVKPGTALPGDIFTVTYTPLKGNTYSNTWTESDQSVQVDLSGDLTSRVGPEGLILLDESSDDRTESYRLYFVAILRQNTAKKGTTPILEEYSLSVGGRDLTKFEETI